LRAFFGFYPSFPAIAAIVYDLNMVAADIRIINAEPVAILSALLSPREQICLSTIIRLAATYSRKILTQIKSKHNSFYPIDSFWVCIFRYVIKDKICNLNFVIMAGLSTGHDILILNYVIHTAA
jgi:hypothetical protein